MIFYKVLGFFDIITIIIMILLSNELVSWKTGMIFAGYMILKGLVFKGDFASTIDLTAGIYIIIMPLFAPKLLTILFILYLSQKALVSFA